MANVTISKLSDGTNIGYIASQAYFSCSTPAGTAAKVATSSDSVTFTDTSLVAGVTVHVYFTYANTATGTLTLKIGNSTAKNIAGTVSWRNGSMVSFTFGGTNWYQNDAYASRLGESTVGSNRLPIYLSNGIPYECYPGDAYLQWGGRNLTSTNSPLDAALISTLGADRFAFIKPSAITVEYSQDGGTAWSEYSLSDDTKARIFAPGIGVSLYLGAHGTAGSGTADDQLRITVDTYTASVYTTIYKWVCYMSTNGHSNCTWSLQLRTTANVINNVDTWVDGFQDVSIGGWPGINITNYQNTIGSNAPTSATNTQYRQFRLIFKQGAASASYASSSIMYIMGYGGVGWATPSNMAKYNSLYSYDSSQNATFPANVTASKFITRNGTSSQFVKGDGSLDSNSYEPLSNKVTSITSSSTDTEYPSAKAVYDLISSSSIPSILVTAKYIYDGGGHYTFTGYSVTAPTVSELYNYTQTSGNRTINFNFADKGEYGQNDSIEACVGAIGLFNNDTSPTAVTIFAYLLGFGASEVDFQIYLTDDASTTTVTKTVYSSVTSISSSSTDTQYPTAKAVYDLFASITDADSISY